MVGLYQHAMYLFFNVGMDKSKESYLVAAFGVSVTCGWMELGWECGKETRYKSRSFQIVEH
jgi:hypothetical protein